MGRSRQTTRNRSKSEVCGRMTTLADGRLQRLLGGEPLILLRKRLRQRFERESLDGGLNRFRISNLSAAEHAALASLLGRPVRFSNSMQVDVQAIDTALQQAGIAASLREALEQIDGPIVHIETARRELEVAWSSVVSVATNPAFANFLLTPGGMGLLKRLSNSNPEAAAQLCSRVQTILGALPANGITRAQLAAKTLGDAHALDSGQAVATMVLAVLRNITPIADMDGVSPDSEEDGVIPRE